MTVKEETWNQMCDRWRRRDWFHLVTAVMVCVPFYSMDAPAVVPGIVTGVLLFGVGFNFGYTSGVRPIDPHK